MAGEIADITFGDLYAAPSLNGLTRPKAVRGDGTFMINMGELFAHDRIGDVAMDRVSLSEREERFLVESGDLLFARASLTLAGAGKVSIVMPATEPRTFESHIIRVRLDREKADPGYYYYLFRSAPGRRLIESIVEQVAAAGIRSSDLARLRVPHLRLKEQQAIACILGLLDDKIELNRRRSRTLEAMARAIFQSWFVDFDPVHAKAAGQPPPGLSPALAALFPDRFEDSSLGPIPAGWRVRSLPGVCEINPARMLRKGEPAPYLDMANMPTQGPSPGGWIIRETGSGMKFVNGDTLVARITPCLENGKTAFVDFLSNGQVGWGSTEYIVLRPKGNVPPVFAYLLARSEEFRSFAIQRMSGSSGRQRVPADSLARFELALPESSNPLFQHLGAIVTPMFERIRTATAESRTLAELRDVLLPKLISGVLRVPKVEGMVGRCT